MNVTLRDVQREDAPWLDTWLARAAASVAYDPIHDNDPSASLFAAIDRGLRAHVVSLDAPVGVITHRTGKPRAREAIIEFVGIEPSHARRGYGQMAAALLAVELATGGVRRIFAPAPEVHGIAMYFWIRLGYRPLLRDEWPCARDGVAWLARDLA